MGKNYLMALDLGGGSCCGLLLDVKSFTITTSRRTWSHQVAPQTNGFGYDLDLVDVWNKVSEVSHEVLREASAEPKQVVGIATTSMRFATVILDANGEVLLGTPNIDARAIEEAINLGIERGRSIHDTTGHWPTPISTGSRLVWMAKNAPDLLKRAHAVISLSDYLGFRLGGRICAERSQAGESQLFDQRSGGWAPDLISSLGLKRDIFPDIIEAGTKIGALTDKAASHLGLLVGTPIIAGGADTQCGLLGSAVTGDGDIGVIAGTTLPIQQVTGEPVLDSEGRLWTGQHVIGGKNVLESNGMAVGTVIDWFARILYPEHRDPTLALFSEARGSKPGAQGVYSTFGASVFDARSLSIPVGNLTMSHMITRGGAAGRRHVSRALIEGIAFSLRANIEQLLAVTGMNPTEIKVSGGLSRSALWTQIVSDVTDRVVSVPQTPEVTALGAAICAGVGAGVFPDLSEGANQVARSSRKFEPDDCTDRYQELYAKWMEAYSIHAPSDDFVSNLMSEYAIERALSVDTTTGPIFRPRILITAPMDEKALRELGELGEVRYLPWRETMKIYQGGQELVDLLEGYQVFVTEADIVDFEALRDLPKLKLIATCRGNPVNVDIESANAYGIPVVNTPGRNADAVADLTVAFMVMLARKLPESAGFLKKEGGEAGDIRRMGEAYIKFQGNELWRKTVGIIGMGNVGTELARRLRGFGARVIFCDPNVSAEEGTFLNTEKVSFEKLLSASDYVSLHAPKTEGTKHLMDRKAFGKMKKGAFLVNTARASLVDDDALLEALESGHLAGAALDVFSVEPPASDDPIVSRANVIATPHIGGDTFEIAAHQGAIVVDQLVKLLRRETPDCIQNPEVMEGFRWTGPRHEPSTGEIERLSSKKKPSISS